MSTTAFPIDEIRADFPILQQNIGKYPLIYLDNAATSQKPRAVIDALVHYYENDNANVHRGLHTLSERATQKFEAARATIKSFINAKETREIIFTRGATEAINLVAQGFQSLVKAEDEIIISEMEHHSNIVPWQWLCEKTGAQLKIIPMDDTGTLKLDVFYNLLSDRTRLIAVTHISNALGTINPVTEIIKAAHAKNIAVLIDGAQGAAHSEIDVQALDCDFYVFSGHKMYGPTGIGVLYGKAEWLERLPPYQGGGEMISEVTLIYSRYKGIPEKFEAGTPNIAGAIGLAAAIHYLEKIGLPAIAAYEQELLNYTTQLIKEIDGIRLIGTSAHKASIVGFILDDVHAHDVGTILNSQGIAVRSGHHCAMPVMHHFNIPATTRISLAFYNTFSEIKTAIEALQKVKEIFTR